MDNLSSFQFFAIHSALSLICYGLSPLVCANSPSHCALLLLCCALSPLCCADSLSHCALSLLRCADSPPHCALSPLRCANSFSHCALSPPRCADSLSHCALSPLCCADSLSHCALSSLCCADSPFVVRFRSNIGSFAQPMCASQKHSKKHRTSEKILCSDHYYLRDSVICFHTEPFASSPCSIRANAIFACNFTSNS